MGTMDRLPCKLAGQATDWTILERAVEMSQAPPVGHAPTNGSLVVPRESAIVRPRAVRPPIRSWSLGRAARIARAILFKTVLSPVAGFFYDVDAVGTENLRNLPGPVIFAANHCAHLDNAFILMTLPTRWRRRVAIAASREGIFAPRLLGLPVKGTLAQLLGNAFPFTQRGRGPARVDHLQSLLEHGWSVLIYPEGRLTVGGPMQPFKPGVGLMAVETGVPVVPVRVDILRPGRWEGGGRFTRGTVRVGFGAALCFDADEEPEIAAGRVEAAVRAL